MSEPFLGEIKLVSFSFPPRGWAFCNGQSLPINQNQALFSLLGTTYGGDGRTTFALPDLRGRTPTHVGAGLTQGERGGEEASTLNIQTMPMHTHAFQALAGAANAQTPENAILADTPFSAYGDLASGNAMNPGSNTSAGGSQTHENMQPWIALNFCIALQGIYPSPN